MQWCPIVPYGVHMNTNEVGSAPLIQAAINRAERSQKWTADKAGIAITTFRRKMNGGGDFTCSEIARVAKALSVHPADLLPAVFARAA